MNGSNSRVGIDALAWLIEQTFDGDPSQSLLANLHDRRGEDWNAMVILTGTQRDL